MSTELNPQTFDVIAFVEGSNFPEKDVTIYTNGKAAMELRELRAQDKPDEKRVKEVIKELEASALTFHLRGLAPKIVELILDKANINSKDLNDEERSQRFIDSTDELTAKTIVSVTNASGAKDESVWDMQKAKALRGYLAASESEKLAEGVSEVNFDAKLFDEAVDAGFSSGRTDAE